MSTKERLLIIFKHGLLLIWAVFALFPLLWMLIMTFKAEADMLTTTFIFTPTLENYNLVLLQSDYLRYFTDSVITSFGAVAVSVLLGVPAAYGFARYSFKYREDLAFQILSFRFAPELLVVLPLFMLYQRMGLHDTYLGLIWVYQLISMPLIIWVVRGYFEDISVEIEHAAQVDGYNWWQIFLKTLVPLIKPGLVSSALLAFIFVWNSFTFPLMLSGFRVAPVTVAAMRYLASHTVQYGQMAVAATISALPAVLFALAIQRHLVRGLSFGAVKG